jgi:hypothetical protein
VVSSTPLSSSHPLGKVSIGAPSCNAKYAALHTSQRGTACATVVGRNTPHDTRRAYTTRSSRFAGASASGSPSGRCTIL